MKYDNLANMLAAFVLALAPTELAAVRCVYLNAAVL